MPSSVDTPPVDRSGQPSADPPRIRVWHVWHPANDDDTLNRVIIPSAREEPQASTGVDARRTAP